MSFITKVEQAILKLLQQNNLPIDSIKLMQSNNLEYGQYQLNEAFKVSKELKKNPVEIANNMKELIATLPYFSNVNVTNPGFINLTFNQDVIITYFNNLNLDIKNHIDYQPSKTILLDYGGPNVSKVLHVGHMRPANIGEALKRLLRAIGITVISDIHIGDSGTPAGMVLNEIKRRNPELPFFEIKDSYPDSIPYTIEDLKTIYPEASKRAKADEQVLNQAKKYAKMLQENHPGLTKLWHLFMAMSIKEIKAVYQDLNIDFELWEGETDSFPYLAEMEQLLSAKNLVQVSDGAKIVDISKPDDKKEIPPFIVYKSDGAALYSTTDLATIIGRVKRFNIDEMWYVTDKRQSLHFEQVFRVSNMLGLTTNIKMAHIGFGTMSGADGKPFKTRDGGVLPLSDLLNQVADKTKAKLSPNVPAENREKINHQVAVSVIKYADLLPICTTDYIFDVDKFSDTEGKTGPYLLYSSVRIKSLLKKAGDTIYSHITKLIGDSDYQVLITLLNLPVTLTNAYHNKSLNEICEYLYKLNSAYNKFYAEHQILSNQDEVLKSSHLALSQLVLNANLLLLDILAIEVPEQM